jgi:alanyl-tRNA synthetase
MPTEKLYWADPFATAFDARGARAGKLGDRPSIVLPRTIFYPEAGGQLADQGELAIGGRSVRVTDVQVDDDGVIHHLFEPVEGDAPALGDDVVVEGKIDRARRLDHMAQHTAQHALSRALVDVAKAETVSARLGATACTLDVDLATLADGALARAEDLVNAVVTSDVVVRSHFPTDEALAKMPLRRTPKVTENIRVIEIDAFDFTPCGGTHCTRTGQIGLVRVVGTERYKGKLRVTFHAGLRALADARVKDDVLGALARDLTCGLLDVGAGVAKLRKDLELAQNTLGTTRGELLELLAERVLAAHPPDPSGATVIAMVRPKDDLAMLRALAGRLTARPDVVAICAAPDPDGQNLAVVVQKGASAPFDCGAWLKAKAAMAGGRGGGRPERAEGRLPNGTPVP